MYQVLVNIIQVEVGVAPIVTGAQDNMHGILGFNYGVEIFHLLHTAVLQ